MFSGWVWGSVVLSRLWSFPTGKLLELRVLLLLILWAQYLQVLILNISVWLNETTFALSYYLWLDKSSFRLNEISSLLSIKCHFLLRVHGDHLANATYCASSGTWNCYPQILFLWIKKPQYLFPHCNSVIQQLNHFVLPWTFSNSFSSLLRCGGQKCKPSLEEGLLLSTFLSLSLGSAPIIFILDMLPIHSICCPLWSLWAFILFVFFHRSSTLLYLWVFFVLVTV